MSKKLKMFLSVQHISLNYFFQDTRPEKDDELEVTDCCGEMNFLGSLASRVFLHQKATVQEAEEVMCRHTYVRRIIPQLA
jgi:hypothetical protein